MKVGGMQAKRGKAREKLGEEGQAKNNQSGVGPDKTRKSKNWEEEN